MGVGWDRGAEALSSPIITEKNIPRKIRIATVADMSNLKRMSIVK
jgi:hypothetical protein